MAKPKVQFYQGMTLEIAAKRVSTVLKRMRWTIGPYEPTPLRCKILIVGLIEGVQRRGVTACEEARVGVSRDIETGMIEVYVLVM